MKCNLATLKVPKIWTLSNAGFVLQDNFKVLNHDFFTYLLVFENQIQTPFSMIIFFQILRCSQNDQILTKITNPALHGA